MEIDFLKALRDVLEDMVRTGRDYEISKIEKIAPQYAGAIYSLLIEKNTVTATTEGKIPLASIFVFLSFTNAPSFPFVLYIIAYTFCSCH